MKLTLVTGNEKKWREIQAILGDSVQIDRQNIDCTIFIIFPSSLIVPEEQGSSVEEIASRKAERAAQLLGGPVIVEDTALAFDNLRGLPGPYIKWFLERLGLDGLAQLGRANISSISDGAASAICTFAYCEGPGVQAILFQGITRGRIVEPRGGDAFGWDPIFEPDTQCTNPPLTYAEMTAAQKNAISHRSKALAALREHFKN